MNITQRANSNILGYNPVLDRDSYKLDHASMYTREVHGLSSYVEPRIKGKTVVSAGQQMWAQKALTTPITKEHVDEAEYFMPLQTPGVPFNREPYDYLINKYGGYLPFEVYGVPEGLISSFPVTVSGGAYSIVQGLEIDAFSRARIDASTTELAEERDAVRELGLI